MSMMMILLLLLIVAQTCERMNDDDPFQCSMVAVRQQSIANILMSMSVGAGDEVVRYVSKHVRVFVAHVDLNRQEYGGRERVALCVYC